MCSVAFNALALLDLGVAYEGFLYRKILLTKPALNATMNAAVVYFSRTGNTKRLAEAIADTAKAPLFELSQAEPAKISAYDLLIFGTPVEGASPAKEARTYLESLPTATGKKAIIFCTWKLFGNERTMKAIEKELSAKGYETVLKVSKKGMKPGQEEDLSKVTSEVKLALEKY